MTRDHGLGRESTGIAATVLETVVTPLGNKEATTEIRALGNEIKRLIDGKK